MNKGKGWFGEPEAHSKVGKRGGIARKERLASEGYAKIGRRGGRATAKQYGSAFYSEIRKGRKNPPTF